MRSFRLLDGLAALLRIGSSPSSDLPTPTTKAPSIAKQTTSVGAVCVPGKTTPGLMRPSTVRAATPYNHGSAHPCLNGCGKTVSANKRICLECVQAVAAKNLQAKGLDVDENEIERAIRAHVR